MDAIQLLTRDHRNVEGLIAVAERASATDCRDAARAGMHKLGR
jgi:2-oxo-4-hydroxy-4-carboxy--5-ureidoimidazoline (OHCU) decarboxylase